MTRDKVVIVRTFEYDPFDLAVAFNHVASEMFGKEPFTGVKSRIWLSRMPVAFSTVKVGVNQEVKVALDRTKIGDVDGEFFLEGSSVQAFVSEYETTRVETFLDKVQTRLKTASIYKGKAMTSSRNFMDLSKFNPSLLVYNQRVMEELRENLWVLIEKTDQCRRDSVRIRRKVLFQGRFGTGKTMAALATAKKATEHGFTVFYLEPTVPEASGAVEFMFELSRKYPPTLLIIEDFDREQRLGDFAGMGRMMAAIDGMTSKDSEILVIFTTNFKDKIAGGFQRPGRIDKTINFNPFNAQDAETLLKVAIPPTYIDPNINWDRVGKAISHMTPAFIGEGIGTGSTLAAIYRANGTDKPLVTEEIILRIAEGLQDQHKACEAAEQTGFVPQR